MDHSKIIAEAAKETLAPLGIFQKGRSRTWIDDRGWWIVVIEFQPSSWGRGSYLNVGAMWLWHEENYFSFDVGNGDTGSRIASFVKYIDEEQFKKESEKLASAAKAETLKLRSRFAAIHDAARYLQSRTGNNDNPWTELAAAIALGYVGKTRKARRLFENIERRKPVHEWEYGLRQRGQAFAETLHRPDDFKRLVKETIYRTRKLLKLPDLTELNLDPKQNAVSQSRKFKLPWL